MSKSDHRRKSSSISKPRRVSSEKKSIIGSASLKAEETLSKGVSVNTVESDQHKINYQDELVLLFVNSMLDIIVEEWVTVPDGIPQVCFCEENRKKNASVIKKFKDVTIEDLENMDVDDLQGSIISLSEKSSMKKKSVLSVAKDSKQDTVKRRRSSKSNEGLNSKSQDENAIGHGTKSHKRRTKDASKTEAVGSHSNIFSYSLSHHSLDWLINPPDENVIIIFKNGNRYEGPVSKFLMHGFGKFIWSDGAIYEGDFVNGHITGHGILQYSDLSVYHGSFCRSFLDGEGVLNIYNTPLIYSGQWKAGKKHGKGWLLYEPGNWYEGEWFEDKRQGTGLRQYQNGTKYQGKWYNGNRHGQGTILWPNNDIYIGEWIDSVMHGYGNYTWNAFLNETLTFPSENTYQGTWVNGMRNGVGIMNFGSANGAQLAGVWEDNKKHGPGVIICNNGKLIEKNPLFWYDKPIHLEIEADPGYPVVSPKHTQSMVSIQNRVDDEKTKALLQMVKEKLRPTFDNIDLEVQSSLESIHIEGSIKSASDFLDGRDQNTPLAIPIHAPPEKTDFTYIIDKVVQKYTLQLYKKEICSEILPNTTPEIHSSTISKYSKWNMLTDCNTGTKLQNYSASTIQNSSEMQNKLAHFQACQISIEQKYLYETIVNNLPHLYKIYDKYATLAAPYVLDFKPILIRLFLWQMLRDLTVFSAKYTLVELDIILAETPGCALETEHYPFEKIYFWQFLQILVTLAWLIHSSNDVTPECRSFGILAAIFDKFLKDVIYVSSGFTSTCSLFEYRDLLPIKNVYLLYKTLGEPHTARKFLKSVCTKSKEQPPCYLKIFKSDSMPKLAKGINVVPVGGNLTYVSEDIPSVGNPPPEPDPEFPIDDEFCEELYLLRCLGPKNIVKCLIAACPRISEKGVIVNMDYPLTFIEFYDVFLMCGFMVVDKYKKQEKRLLVQEEKEVTGPIESETKTPDKASKGRDKKKGKK